MRPFPGLLPEKLTEKPANPFKANFILGENILEEPSFWETSSDIDIKPLRERNSLFRSAGIQVIPKVFVNWIETSFGETDRINPIYSLYGEEWAFVPTMQESTSLAVCPGASRYANWLTWLVSERLTRDADFDGLFLDRAWLYPCRNHPHGCGFMFGKERIRAVYPIKAERQLFRRIFTAIREKKPEGLIIAHDAGFKSIPYLSFADFHFDSRRSLPGTLLSA